MKTQGYENNREVVNMNAYNTYGYKSNTSLKRKPSVWNTFVRVLRATASVTCERLATVEIRTISLVAGFILALGLVGGMECGSIPMYVGMPACLLLGGACLLTNFDD